MTEELSILSQTIRDHASKLAHQEWTNEHNGLLKQILENAGINDTLCVDGREIPSEAITRAIRQAYVESRTKTLINGLTNQIVETAFRRVLEEEQE